MALVRSPERSPFIQSLPNVKLDLDIVQTNILLHDDWAKNVISRVKLPPPPPPGHVFQLTRTIFELNSHNKATKVLTKVHEIGPKMFSLYTYREKCPTHWWPYINKTNVLTNLHDDWAKIVTSRVFTCHVFQLTRTIFELNSHIKETNAKNVTSRVFTCFHYKHIEKNAAPTGGHVFSQIWTIFKLVGDINKTNVLTNFHDDWAKIVTSRPNKENCPAHWGPCFQRTGTTFELDQHIIMANILTNFELGRDFIEAKLLTKFHEDGTRNVASRVFTSTDGHTLTKTGQKSSPEQSDKALHGINCSTKTISEGTRRALQDREVNGRRHLEEQDCLPEDFEIMNI
ncbi:hypothetical protein DPMN_004624 [Dreissena polymorpha]|uniref:Uncharacterized protein n=1 Tax=Dreissena polymorpha TaxID=45954 RepID=A0A9D4MN53_DREPO|nr:hypothetical protein DPMN_004624 [Dreissena polymorpha]